MVVELGDVFGLGRRRRERDRSGLQRRALFAGELGGRRTSTTPVYFYDTSCLFDPARSELGDATSVWVQCFVSGLSTPPARFEIRATVCR